MIRGLVAAGIAALGVLAAAPASASTITYTFDGGVRQGWQVANNFDTARVNALANPSGGNPGGHLFFNDAVTDQSATFFPPSFPPGTLAANYGGSLSFDLGIKPSGLDRQEIAVFIASPTESILTRFPASTETGFRTYSFPLRARVGSDYVGPGGAFTSPANEAQWRRVLAEAIEMEVMFDAYYDPGDEYALDNFRVSDPPPVVPPPQASPETPAAQKPKCKKRKKQGRKPGKRCKRKKKKRR